MCPENKLRGRKRSMYRFIVIGIILILAYLLLKKFLFPSRRVSDRRRDDRRIKGEELVEDANVTPMSLSARHTV